MNTLKMQQTIRKVLPFLLALLIIGSCDVYQHQSYTISAFDQKACQAITENAADSVFTVNLGEINPAWADTTMNTDLVNTVLDSLNKRGQTIADQERAYLIVPQTVFNDVYFKFTASADKVVLFSDNSVDIQIWKTDGTPIFPDKSSIDLETIASCSTIITRVEFSGIKGETLLKIGKNDQSKKQVFHLVILKK